MVDFIECPKCENTIAIEWETGPGIFLRCLPVCTVNRCGWKSDTWMNSLEIQKLADEQDEKAALEEK